MGVRSTLKPHTKKGEDMKKILVTGGPVHAHLDAVKVITNRFKGGLMCQLSEALSHYDMHITYVCAPAVGALTPKPNDRITVVTHKGFEDYRRKVVELAPSMDGVVLGAAVANLIPANPWRGKFPSHDYKPGDVIPIDFTIAPRVIDEVKRVAPKTHLFGYKLLDHVAYGELIKAAYGIVLEAKATAVFANDTADLQQKFAVTKERGVHPLGQNELAPWIREMLDDVYYSSAHAGDDNRSSDAVDKVKILIERYRDKFLITETGLIFGTVAVRNDGGFVTTGRGKRELDSIAHVTCVDHDLQKVYVGGTGKASLNAPLLARMFENQNVDYIVHYHEQVHGLPTYGYAPPGTVRDVSRPNLTSFNIREHGCMLLFDKQGRQI